MTTPSAFTKDPEELIREVQTWITEEGDKGGLVSMLTLHRKIQPLVEALQKERAARSTSASLIRDGQVQLGALATELAHTKDLNERLTQDLFRLEQRLGVRILFWLDEHNPAARLVRRMRSALSVVMPFRP